AHARGAPARRRDRDGGGRTPARAGRRRSGRRDGRAAPGRRAMSATHDARSLPEVHATVHLPTGGNWLRRMLVFAGPAYLVSVGYMDPGNWATDLAGGARFGYRL